MCVPADLSGGLSFFDAEHAGMCACLCVSVNLCNTKVVQIDGGCSNLVLTGQETSGGLVKVNVYAPKFKQSAARPFRVYFPEATSVRIAHADAASAALNQAIVLRAIGKILPKTTTQKVCHTVF